MFLLNEPEEIECRTDLLDKADNNVTNWLIMGAIQTRMQLANFTTVAELKTRFELK